MDVEKALRNLIGQLEMDIIVLDPCYIVEPVTFCSMEGLMEEGRVRLNYYKDFLEQILKAQKKNMEHIGIEPMTSRLQGERSPNMN